MSSIFIAYERNAALVLASEKWAAGYEQTPELHGKLLKTNARLERKILMYFRDLARNSHKFINWKAYSNARRTIHASRVDAYDVSVIVKQDDISNEDTPFITVVFDDIALATALGAQAGETTYHIPLGLDKQDAAIQRLAREQVARLVSRTIDIHGKPVTDTTPDAFTINDKTIKDIQESIRTSLDLGETVQDAANRLQTVIRNPRRAQMIANTETVNAYNGGLYHFGNASGAIGKQWTDNGANDICATNTGDGIIPYDAVFSSGHQHPTAHPNCRCYIRLVYQNELDANPNLFG